jgi:hypothetical protein
MVSPEQFQTFWRVAARGKSEEMIGLLRLPGVEINIERQSLQALGCGESVIAQIPLTDEQFSILRGAAAEQ